MADLSPFYLFFSIDGYFGASERESPLDRLHKPLWMMLSSSEHVHEVPDLSFKQNKEGSEETGTSGGAQPIVEEDTDVPAIKDSKAPV